MFTNICWLQQVARQIFDYAGIVVVEHAGVAAFIGTDRFFICRAFFERDVKNTSRTQRSTNALQNQPQVRSIDMEQRCKCKHHIKVGRIFIRERMSFNEIGLRELLFCQTQQAFRRIKSLIPACTHNNLLCITTVTTTNLDHSRRTVGSRREAQSALDIIDTRTNSLKVCRP